MVTVDHKTEHWSFLSVGPCFTAHVIGMVLALSVLSTDLWK